MELKRINHVTVTKAYIFIISAIIYMALAVVSWGADVEYFQEILVWICNFFHNSNSPFFGIYFIRSSEACYIELSDCIRV
jgi:hypothetical protein